MNALLLTEYLKLELTPMPEPEIGPGDVLIRVRACGICGSDVHGFDGSTGRRIPPLVMGHDANCGAWIRKYREPSPEGDAGAGAGGRREGGRRRARA